MMAFSPLNEEEYEKYAIEISYLKMFEYILKDFVSREDAKEMMRSSNLPVTTSVSTTVNTAVSVALPSPVGTGVGVGTGSGTGNTQPIYIGDSESPGSQILKRTRKAELQAGGAKAAGFTAEIKATAGGEV